MDGPSEPVCWCCRRLLFLIQSESNLNADLSFWDVGNATTLNGMFESVSESIQFNQDLSTWDVSNVVDMGYKLQW
jgi:surface protein